MLLKNICKNITGSLLFLFPLIANAQSKLSADVSFGIRQSFSNDILKMYSTEPSNVTIEYYSRRKYRFPYFNLLSNVSYGINKRIALGIQSGIYVHYQEKYSTGIKRTTITLPLQLTARFSMLNYKDNVIGFNVAAGILFFRLDEFIDTYNNSSLVNTSVFCKTKNGSILKIGMEKQADFVTVNLKNLSQYSPEETFKHPIKRLAFAISYGIVIKKGI